MNNQQIILITLVLILGVASVNALQFTDNSQADFNNGNNNRTYYNNSINAVQLNLTYDSGSYLSRIFDAGSLANWTNLSWIQGAPYNKELPDNQEIEEVIGGANMTGNVLLTHLNDGASTTVFIDTSGNNNNGSCSGGNCPTWTNSGKFGGAYSFDGNDRIGTGITTQLNDFAVEVWFKDDGDNKQYERLADKSYTQCFWLGRSNTNPNTWGGGIKQTRDPYGVFVTLEDEEWHQIVLMRKGTTQYVYGDGGKVIATKTGVSGTACDTTALAIGAWGAIGSTQQRFTGVIDEVAIWNRSLSAEEILNHYKRGIARLSLSIKSCDDENCSGESWNQTFENSPILSLNLDNNRYFQYQTYFFTEDTSLSPELFNFTIGYDILDNTAPIINLESPENETTNTTDKTPEFRFNTIDETASTLDCSLWMNKTSGGTVEIIATNSSVINGTSTPITPLSPLSNGLFNWWINCSDGYNSNISEKRLINISVPDLISPTISLVSPENNIVNTTNNTPDFSFIPSDNKAEVLSCELWLNSTVSGTPQSYGINPSINNGSLATITANSSLANQNYTWWVNCSEGSNTKASEKRNIKIHVDVNSPSVNLKIPTNNNNEVDFSNVNFSGLITDDIELKNVSLYSDYSGVWQFIENRVISGISSPVSFVKNILPTNQFINNNFKWNLLAYDNKSGSNWSSENNTFSNWDLGTHDNALYNNTQGAITLDNYSLDGTYTSQIFDAGSIVGWKNISWSSNAIDVESDIDYFNNAESKSYYSQNTYSVRHWYNTSGVASDFSEILVQSALDCDGSCSGTVNIRIGNSTSWSDHAFLDSSLVRVDGTTSDYTYYNNTYSISKQELGEYFFVQLLIYTESGTINFLMDESGPDGPDPEYRSGSNGDGSQTGWTDDNGDYAIKIKLLKNTNLDLYVRSCDDSICNGESWSDGLSNSTLSELPISNNIYFQYKVALESVSSSETPKLFNVTINTGEADSQAPIVTLISPTNNAGDHGNITTFIYNVSDESPIGSCKLILNDITQDTNTSIERDTTQQFTLSQLNSGTYNWHINCSDINNYENSSETRTITIAPSYDFSGLTTDLSQVNIESIPNLVLEKPTFGLINFSETINLSGGANINGYVTISNNFIEIDSNNLPQLNKSATLTLYNLSIQNPVILKNGFPCSDCEIQSFTADKNLTFTVQSFSNYSASENSQLEIWDDTDYTRTYGRDITFYANYTNTTSNQPITGADCYINFSDTSSNMQYEADSGLYEYNRTFSVGVHYFNITCSAADYTSLNLTDYASVDSSDGPNGANVTVITSERAPSQSPGNHSAYAGNVTQLNLLGKTITQSWQGYFGNVSGVISLGDGNDNIFYNWSAASPSGEVYATRALDVNFATIGCADSLDLSNEEAYIGQSSSDADSVSNTFNQQNHPEFYTGPIQINANTCNSTNIFDNSGTQSNYFHEVLLADGASNIVYTSILEQDKLGFDSRTHDFEMIVGENGHGTDIQTVSYYFYVELN